MSYYAALNNKLNVDSDNFNYVMNHMPPTYASTDAYIKDYVSNLSANELKARADGLIRAQNLKQNNELIDYMLQKSKGNFSHYRSQWSPIMWQAHEKDSKQTVKIGDKIVNAGDLDYSIAEALEVQDAHTDPVSEYYGWIKLQDHIEGDIRTGGATCEEIHHRNRFIDFMEHRETEIKRIATLYSAAALNPHSPMQKIAQEKLSFTLFKLSELRRLRDKMKATKSTPDKCKHDIKREKYLKEQQENKQNQVFSYAYNPVIEEKFIKAKEEKDNDISLGEQRLASLYMSQNLSQGITDNLLSFRPVSETQEEAIQKMTLAQNNHNAMREMLKAMRNGMSREEWIKMHYPKIQEQTYTKELRGFNINNYNQALRDLNK